MIPYIDPEKLVIPLFGPLKIQPFGVMVVIALIVGYHLSKRRARAVGLDPEVCGEGVVWTSVGGFVLGHILQVLFYFPERLVENPLLLFKLNEGLSSFGGFAGGALGAFIYFKRKKVSILQYAEAIVFGLVPGWIFGRMGCTIAHDHPGRHTDFIFAVKYPDGPRFDLGLYEMVYTVILTVILYAFRKKRPFHGFHIALVMFLYAPVRFLFDFLRTADRHYLGLTPGQYWAIGMALFAAWLVHYGLKLRAQGYVPGVGTPGEPFRAAAARAAAGAGKGRSGGKGKGRSGGKGKGKRGR